MRSALGARPWLVPNPALQNQRRTGPRHLSFKTQPWKPEEVQGSVNPPHPQALWKSEKQNNNSGFSSAFTSLSQKEISNSTSILQSPALPPEPSSSPFPLPGQPAFLRADYPTGSPFSPAPFAFLIWGAGGNYFLSSLTCRVHSLSSHRVSPNSCSRFGPHHTTQRSTHVHLGLLLPHWPLG